MRIEIPDYLVSQIDQVASLEDISRDQCVLALIQIGLVTMRPNASAIVATHLAEHKKLGQPQLDAFAKAHP